MSARKNRKFRILQGPEISTPFIVVRGIAVIITGASGFPLVAGCTWPGHELTPELQEHLRPLSVQLIPDTELSFLVTRNDLQNGMATVRVAAMLSGPLSQRIELLPEQSLNEVNRKTLASALNVTREAFTVLLRRRGTSQDAASDEAAGHSTR